ncbi:MAG: DUF89 family protein [Methanocorpusculum parvum]|nr:DUF89 family protein [Methanocorpusculum parvum]
MKLAPECRSCLLTKVRSQAASVLSDAEQIDRLVEQCAEIFDAGAKELAGAAIAAGEIHRFCYAQVNNKDLYAEIKVRDNERAKAVAEEVQPMLHTLHDTLIASVLGNAMDYGVTGHNVAEDFGRYFCEVFSHGLAIDDSKKFLPLADRVVFFTDNCGEVIFDMLFIQELKKAGSHVTVVVKDGPMLNDVTLKEAKEIGLFSAADAVYTGGGGALLGTHPHAFPPEVSSAVSQATLLIAKGLANYESMTEYEFAKPIAYLMMIKCDAVGRDLSEYSGRTVKKGDLVAYLRE